MRNTALQDRGAGVGGDSRGEYRGATTAARFGDPQAEFRALRESCGVYDLGFRAQIALTGADRVRWLNGMVTNNIRDLQAGHGVYAFLLNPQGHILGDLYAYNCGESITVTTDRSQVEKVLATFDHYIIMDDVEVANPTEQTALGIAGPKARSVLQAAGVQIPELQPLESHKVTCDCDCGCVNCTVIRTDDAVAENYEIWMDAAHVWPTWQALMKAGAAAVGFEALEWHRVTSGIPLYGTDIRERDLPQETEQARALNFNKGCYVGQEIVERIRSRGNVHRKFAGFAVEASVARGAKIVTGEKEVGEVTSVADVRFENETKTVALGYIRREVGTPGREVVIAGVKGQVISMPMSMDAAEGSLLVRHSA